MHEYRSPAMKRLNCLLSEMDAAYHEAAQRQGQNDSTSRILYALCELGSPASLRAVCESTGLSKQTVNSALKNLEEEGLIRLESAQGDRRSKEVFLTEAGSELAAASVDRVLAIEEQAALRLSPEERLAILALERRHVEALRQEAERFLAENKED